MCGLMVITLNYQLWLLRVTHSIHLSMPGEFRGRCPEHLALYSLGWTGKLVQLGQLHKLHEMQGPCNASPMKCISK